jgi:hypothetical protein
LIVIAPAASWAGTTITMLQGATILFHPFEVITGLQQARPKSKARRYADERDEGVVGRVYHMIGMER